MPPMNFQGGAPPSSTVEADQSAVERCEDDCQARRRRNENDRRKLERLIEHNQIIFISIPIIDSFARGDEDPPNEASDHCNRSGRERSQW